MFILLIKKRHRRRFAVQNYKKIFSLATVMLKSIIAYFQQASAKLATKIVKNHSWGLKIQFFPRSAVDFLLYFHDFFFCNEIKISSFGEVLTD